MRAPYISEDEFWDDWGVIQKDDGVLFECDEVKDQPIHHVWTVVESDSSDDESWYALPGLHYVNRIGYVMTKEPWANELREAIYFLSPGRLARTGNV